MGIHVGTFGYIFTGPYYFLSRFTFYQSHFQWTVGSPDLPLDYYIFSGSCQTKFSFLVRELRQFFSWRTNLDPRNSTTFPLGVYKIPTLSFSSLFTRSNVFFKIQWQLKIYVESRVFKITIRLCGWEKNYKGFQFVSSYLI